MDYQCCGSELQAYNLVDFFMGTYETEITRADHEAELVGKDTHHGPGCPCNTHVRYLSTHPKEGSFHQIIHSSGHRNLPNFLGKWFPRNNDPETYNFYCACMLVLLKPWQNLKDDLKSDMETWASSFEAFHASAS